MKQKELLLCSLRVGPGIEGVMQVEMWVSA